MVAVVVIKLGLAIEESFVLQLLPADRELGFLATERHVMQGNLRVEGGHDVFE